MQAKKNAPFPVDRSSRAADPHFRIPVALRRQPVSSLALAPPTPAVPRLVAVPVVVANITTPRPTSVPELSKPKRFPVASIDFSKKDVGLPYGAPRRISGATLKALAGGRSADHLLRKTVKGWEFVSDTETIDLTDTSITFKLGRLTIFS